MVGCAQPDHPSGDYAPWTKRPSAVARLDGRIADYLAARPADSDVRSICLLVTSKFFGQLRKLVYGASPAFLEPHLFMFSAVLGILVEGTGDVSCAATFVFHCDD